jgi:hypothetical protein
MRPHRGRRARWPHTRRRRAQRRYPGTRSLPGKCALCEDARVNIGAGLFGDGDVPAPPWPSRPGIDSIDPRGAASGHARPSLGARRSTRPAVRVSGVSPNAVSRCSVSLFPSTASASASQPHHRNGPLGFKNALSRVSPLNETARGQTRNSALSRGGAKLGETNEREICEGRQAGPARGTRGARGTHTTACLVRLHHRDVFGIARRKVRPATADATDRTADPCPSAALPRPGVPAGKLIPSPAAGRGGIASRIRRGARRDAPRTPRSSSGAIFSGRPRMRTGKPSRLRLSALSPPRPAQPDQSCFRSCVNRVSRVRLGAANVFERWRASRRSRTSTTLMWATSTTARGTP